MKPNSNQFPGNWKSMLKLLCGCLGRWTGHISKMRKKIPHLLISISPWWALVQIWFKMKKWPKIENYGGENCVGWHEIKWIPLILYIKLISVKSWTFWMILRIKHPRILVPPTLFQKLSEIFKNRFPRKLDQNFDIPRIRMIHCISFNNR